MSVGIAVVSLFLVFTTSFATDYFVDAVNGDDTNSGKSAGEAWATITQALSLAKGYSSDQAIINIAEGTYSASTNGEEFPLRMKSYFSFLGEGPENTIIDGEGDAYHVIRCQDIRYIEISDLAIRGGCANGNSTNSYGGGFYAKSTSVRMDNCLITDNEAVFGGGVYLMYSTARITDCEIMGNKADGDLDDTGSCGGGGVASLVSTLNMLACAISDNIAKSAYSMDAYAWGGGVYFYDETIQTESLSSIRNCTIAGNFCDGEMPIGGGICLNNTNPTIEGCLFQDNAAQMAGAIRWGEYESDRRVLDLGDDTRGQIRDCVFLQNDAYAGGGVYVSNAVPLIHNCLFTENSASYSGGALQFEAYSGGCSPVVSNCTIAGNSATFFGGGIRCFDATPEVVNSIIWGHDDGISVSGGAVNISYSCLFTSHSGEGNFFQDPLFVSGPDGEFYLSSQASGEVYNSPCIDAGSDSAESLELERYTTRTDLGLDSGVVDIGYHYPLAFEYPTTECYLNEAQFAQGDLLEGTLKIENKSEDIEVDLYVAFVLPDGAIFSLTYDGLPIGIFPWEEELSLPQGYSWGPIKIIQVLLPGGLPNGDYIFASALSTPGEFEIIGEISIFWFSVEN